MPGVNLWKTRGRLPRVDSVSVAQYRARPAKNPAMRVIPQRRPAATFGLLGELGCGPLGQDLMITANPPNESIAVRSNSGESRRYFASFGRADQECNAPASRAPEPEPGLIPAMRRRSKHHARLGPAYQARSLATSNPEKDCQRCQFCQWVLVVADLRRKTRKTSRLFMTSEGTPVAGRR